MNGECEMQSLGKAGYMQPRVATLTERLNERIGALQNDLANAIKARDILKEHEEIGQFLDSIQGLRLF